MKQNKKPLNFLSVIVPAYKQEKTIKMNIKRLRTVLDSLKISYELIVVVDGKIDKTFQKAQEIESSTTKIVGYEHNHGKGYAVRFGMANSKGNIIAFLDAGMDLDPKSIILLLELLEKENADIVIGSKLHPLSKVNYPIQRKLLSWGYRSLVKLMFDLSVRDTQVGLKIYKKNVLQDVLPRLLVKTFAFDIEMLAVAHHIGYTKILEAPIELKYAKWSSITSKNFWMIIYRMVWDTLAVFYRLRILHYYDTNSKRKWRYDPELNFRINLG